jgi:DNA-binding transcriptional regulator YiaG
MTATEYKAARIERGSQVVVAAKLGVRQATISDRERGASPVSKEAALALLALPKLRKRA